jgi:hypothetical protein
LNRILTSEENKKFIMASAMTRNFLRAAIIAFSAREYKYGLILIFSILRKPRSHGDPFEERRNAMAFGQSAPTAPNEYAAMLNPRQSCRASSVARPFEPKRRRSSRFKSFQYIQAHGFFELNISESSPLALKAGRLEIFFAC